MKIHILVLFLAIYAFTFKITSDQCRFAKKYITSDFINDPSKVNDFFRNFIRWEADFINVVGTQQRTGLTLDGIRIDVVTGQLLPQSKHLFTAASKQSLHFGILAKILQKAQFSQQISEVTKAFKIIQQKIVALQKFHKQYPGFGGYLPWIAFNESKISPTWDFKDRVPALDNGEMFWGALSLSKVWQKYYPNVFPQLRTRFDSITWIPMIKNARKIFYNETTNKIRAVADIQNISLPVDQNTYSNKDNYYLDDPYEGQLFIWIITLYGQDLFTRQEIQNIWVNKRNKLQSVNYKMKSSNQNITVQKGFWFSSHQQWKNLFLPYRLSQTYYKIQVNNQKARLWNSVDKNIPGLYGCQAGPASKNQEDTGYFCSGIQQLAFSQVTFDQLVTPYGAFPLLLVNKQIGAAWLHNTIASPAGQTRYGSLEGVGLNGTKISPTLTWDTKISAALAVMNGTWNIIKNHLQKQGKLSLFIQRVQNQYSLAFPVIQGLDVNLPLPNKMVRSGRDDFTNCQ